MSRADAQAVLQGDSDAYAMAMTWVPPGAIRMLTWGSGVENEAEGLQAVATALSLDLAFVPSGVPWAEEAVKRLHEADIAAGCLVDGVFVRVAERRGWSDALRVSAAGPGGLAFALDEALHDVLQEVRAARALDADVLLIADELAGAAGWLVAPDFVFDALVPCYRRIAQQWVDTAHTIVFHSDGDIRALMPMLKGAGYDAVHFGLLGESALQTSVDAARNAGLCPMGAIEARSLMARGARHTGAFAGQLAHAGPIVISDDGGMTSAEEVAAFSASLDAARAAAAGE